MKVGFFRVGRKGHVGSFSKTLVLLVIFFSTFAPSLALATNDDPFKSNRNAVSPKQSVSVTQSSGAMTYSYPLAIPPGRSGMQPNLSLDYSSADKRTDSVFGYGWSMNLPYIERVNKLGTDKLFNQDRDHTFFTSSLSGELLPLKNSTPVGGSFLGVSESTASVSLLDMPAQFASYFADLATSPDTSKPDPALALHTFPETFQPSFVYHPNEEEEYLSLREQAAEEAALPLEGFAVEDDTSTSTDAVSEITSVPPATPIAFEEGKPIWINSQEVVVYDTADGSLHPGEYALQPDGKSYFAYMPTSTVQTATTTYDTPAHFAGINDPKLLDGLSEVHETGRAYVDTFSDGIRTWKTPSTRDGYERLKAPNPSNPKYSEPLTLSALLRALSPAKLFAKIMDGLIGLKTAFAAIASDGNAASLSSCTSGTSCTYPYTVSGTNTFLMCNTSSYNSTPGTTTMSYAGLAMTEIGSQQFQDTLHDQTMTVDTFYLAGPSIGANNLVITTTNSVSGFYAHCASYSGTDQVSPVESNYQNQFVYPSCSQYSGISAPITTQNNGAWVVAIFGDSAGRIHEAASPGHLVTTDQQGDIIDFGPISPTTTATVTSVPVNGDTGCLVTAIGLKPNTNPITSTALQVETLTNPSNISSASPSFSAVYTQASSSLLATSYEIQVSTSSVFANLYWDSAQQTLPSTTPSGQRSPLLYSTTTFARDGVTYYWRIKFWDSSGQAGSWSSKGNYFVMQIAGDYMAKVDDGSFMRYTLGADGSWTAYDKRGWKYIFGATSNARIFDPTASSSIARWYLEEVVDTNGNKILYRYTKDNSQVYPNYIDYTDHGGGSLAEIGFTKSLCDASGSPCTPSATSSIYGFPVFSRYLISDITASSGNVVVHRYTPTYTLGDNQARMLLASIQEKGYNDATGGGALSYPATTFSYQTSTSTWAEVTDPNSYQIDFDITDNSSNDKGYRLADANGDSLPDWLISDGTTNTIRFNNGKKWGTASSSWTLPAPFSLSGVEQSTRFADVDGDGYIDIISATSSNNHIYLNNRKNGWATSSYVFPLNVTDKGGVDYGVQIVDVNGDNLADIIHSYSDAYSGTTTQVFINNGAGWAFSPVWSIPELFISNQHDTSARLYDYNGDGLIDIIYSPTPFATSSTRVYYNTGKGWERDYSASVPIAFADPTVSLASSDQGARFADINGDGCVDIVQSHSGTGIKSVRTSNCRTGWNTNVTNTLPEYFRDNTNDYGVRLDDVNGDGQIDFVRGYYDGASTHTWKVYLKNGDSPDLLKTVVNARGGKTTVSYQGSPRYLDESGAMANSSLPVSLQTVRTLTTDSGAFAGAQRVLATTTYEYQRGYLYSTSSDPYNRQFAGFGLVIESKPNGAATKTYFHQGDSSDSANGEYNDNIAKSSRPYRVETLDGTTTSARLYSRTINKWARANYGDGRNFVKLVASLTQTFDGDTTHRDIAASSTYDDTTGNISVRESFGEVFGNSDGTWTDTGGDAATTTFSYAASSTLVSLLLPSRELVVDQTGTTIKDTKWYYDSLPLGYASIGNRTKEETLISGSAYASSTATYTAYGLLATSTDPVGNQTAYTYDGYNLFPIKITNALGQQKLISYDYSSGKAATTTDANSQTVVTVYDNLDRPILEKMPDFTTPGAFVTKSVYTYVDATTTVSSVQKTDYLSSATSTDSYVYTDGFGRTLQAKSEAEAGNGWTTKDSYYNSIGAVASDTLPYFTSTSAWSTPTTTASLFTNYYYDMMGRLSTTTDAVGTSSVRYSDWQVTSIDALGNKKDAYKDAYGNLAQVVEYPTTNSPATSTYAWNRLGKMTKLTDALGNVRNFTYDLLGRLTKSEDLHASADSTYGSSTRAYDAASNVTTVVTPNNQTVNFTYDKLNRQLTEDYTGSTGTEVVYTYDSCTNGAGRLCKVVKQGSATTTYAYNPIGLTTSEAKQIGTSWGTTTSSYLRNGAVNIAVYPDLSQVGYVYDDAGLLESVLAKEPSVATSSVILSLGYSPAGQTSVIKYTNGVTATSTYDATKKYRLTGKVAGKGTSTLQNISYVYDTVGNITQASDIASSSARKSVSYNYDALYRLLSASTTAVATGTNPYLQSFTYDVLGNMLTGPSGTYSYAQTGYSNPDAATAIVTTTTTQGGGSSPSTSTPAYVQSAIGQSSAAFASNVTTGNLVVVGVTIWNTSIPTNAVTDNKGNTYTRIGEAINATTDHLALFYAANVTGGSSFTVSSSVGGTVSVHEYSGIATSSPLDKTASSTGSSGTALSSGNVTPAVTNELIFGLAWSELDGSSWTAGSGYTLRTQETNNNTAERSAGEDKVATSTSAVAATFTTGGSAPWTAMVATFKPLVTQSGGGIVYSTSTLSYDNAGNLLGNGALTNTWDYHNYLTQTAVGGGGGTATSTIAVVATSSLIHTTFSTGPTTKTWTATTSGTDRLLVLTADVFQDVAGTGSITSATYGGVALTKASSTRQSNKSVEIWYLKNPATGGNTMSVTVTGAHNDLKFSTIALTGVDQTTPLESVSYALGTSGNPSVSLTTTNAGDALVATLHRHTTADATSSRTSIFKNRTGLTFGGASYHLATATQSYADTYTGSVAGQNWAMLMAAFKPSVTSGGSSTTLTYLYDENGKRVMLIDPTSTTTRYYSGLYQDTLGGYKKTKNIFVNGALLATFEKTGSASATAYYVLSDPLNSASILMNASGVATQTLDYLPYGDVRVNAKQTSYDSDRKFLGKINDVTTNLDYLEARYYQAPLGRFISQDPILLGAPDTKILVDPQVLNYYGYSSDNPINKSDPSGLFNVTTGYVEKGDTAGSIATQLNLAYSAKYNTFFSEKSLLNFNMGNAPVAGSYYGFQVNVAPSNTYISTPSATTIGTKQWVDAQMKFTTSIGVGGLTHGNSLNSQQVNTLYVLVKKGADKEAVKLNDILKIGESIDTTKRYSNKFLNSVDAELLEISRGSKEYIHSLQNRMINWFKTQSDGARPPLNKSDY